MPSTMLRPVGDSSSSYCAGSVSNRRLKIRANGMRSIGRKMTAKKALLLCLSLSLLLLLRLQGLAEATQAESKSKTPIVVGQSSYWPPYRKEYGERVGSVLQRFHDRGFQGLQDSEKTTELIDWCIELGHAHLDDAMDSVVFEKLSDRRKSNHANLPEHYHYELALQAYDFAAKGLLGSRKETDFLEMDPMAEHTYDALIRLVYYVIIQFSKGTVFASMTAKDSTTHSSSSEDLYSSAIAAYRKSKTLSEQLRYIYSKPSTVALHESKEEFTELYYSIEALYADSCFELGILLYSKRILTENAQVAQFNEKITELVQSQFGVDGDGDLDLVASLMDQANGGKGFGGGGAGTTTTMGNLDEVMNFVTNNMMGGELGGVDSEEWNSAMVEIAELLDTAILTNHQHANPPPEQKGTDQEEPRRKMKVIVNGVVRKSKEELIQDELRFPWRASLATVYQEAATVATARNQHIRSRELMNLALALYVDAILPYYQEQELRDKKLQDWNRQNLRHDMRSTRTEMTQYFAELAAGHLYIRLADTAFILGGYENSKEAYSKGMDWYRKYDLHPEPDEKFNIFAGDEVARRQYQDYVTTMRQELDQYKANVRSLYMYKDENYEAGMFLSIAPLYLAMGQAKPAIDFYKDAIAVYERFTTNDLTNESNKLALLNLADAQFGLATAYFHEMRYEESEKQHSLSCQLYQHIYGEGNPPKTGEEASLEDMKDEIIQNYGQDYYDQLKTFYDGSSGNGAKSEGSNQPKVAANFKAFGYDNETLGEDEGNYYYQDEEETWSNDEL